LRFPATHLLFEILRAKGESLLLIGNAQAREQAEGLFLRSIDISRHQHALGAPDGARSRLAARAPRPIRAAGALRNGRCGNSCHRQASKVKRGGARHAQAISDVGNRVVRWAAGWRSPAVPRDPVNAQSPLALDSGTPDFSTRAF